MDNVLRPDQWLDPAQHKVDQRLLRDQPKDGRPYKDVADDVILDLDVDVRRTTQELEGLAECHTPDGRRLAQDQDIAERRDGLLLDPDPEEMFRADDRLLSHRTLPSICPRWNCKPCNQTPPLLCDGHPQVEVAVRAILAFKSFAFQPQPGPGSGAGRDRHHQLFDLVAPHEADALARA